MKRRLWLLGKGQLRPVLLGPGVRMLAIAGHFAARGWKVELAMDACARTLPPGVSFHPLRASLIGEIRPGDAVLVTTFLPPALLLKLAFSRLPYHVDFYNVGAMETLETAQHRRWPLGLSIRRRSAAKYRLLLSSASRFCFSTRPQITFVAGMLYDRCAPRWARLATRLPARSQLVPMGVDDTPWTAGRTNPYPEALRNRPIFLWGGGIWSWFDVPTLLRAFQKLQERNHPACLYFLAGRNPSGLAAQNAPVQAAIDGARELGILDRNVFFHNGAVTTEEVPAYLEHAAAAALANPASIESLGCWRTRLLPAMWAGKPLVVSGYDPLSAAMAEVGAARLVPAGDANALADAIAAVADDPTLRKTMSEASCKAGENFRWSRLLAGLEEDLTSPVEERPRPRLIDALRYLAGI